jgi:SPX domain protein involved in polyphosphate accumulation
METLKVNQLKQFKDINLTYFIQILYDKQKTPQYYLEAM